MSPLFANHGVHSFFCHQGAKRVQTALRFGEVLTAEMIYVMLRERLPSCLQETATVGVDAAVLESCAFLYIYFLCLNTSTFNWERGGQYLKGETCTYNRSF